MRRSAGLQSMGKIPKMNRSAKGGARSSLHFRDEGALIHPPHQGVCGQHGTEEQRVTVPSVPEFVYFKFSDFKLRARLTDNARRNGMRRLRIKTVIHPDVSPEAVVRSVLASPPTTQTPKNTAQAQASN